MLKFKRSRNYLASLGLRVGILFNVVAAPARKGDIDYISESEVQDQVKAVQDAIMKLGLACHMFPVSDDVRTLVSSLELHKPDVVVNICESFSGRSQLEMNVPAILELLKVPYTGSPPLTLGLCQNKALAKDVLRANGVPTPDYVVLENFEDWKGGIDYPLFVKPLREDASLGITKKSFVRNEKELKAQTVYIRKRYRQPALVEKYIDGRELNVSIIGYEKPKVLPISEIVFEFEDEPKIVDYSAKWLEKTEEYSKTKPICPANLKPSIEKLVKKTALQAYRLLNCRDYARVDIRLKDDVPFVLEVNPNPDISPEAGFARSLRAARITYTQFIRDIIWFALRRSNF